jgi:ATP-dependent RNA helicase RhlE
LHKSLSSLPSSPRGNKVFRNNRFSNSRAKRTGVIDPSRFVNQALVAEAVEPFAPRYQFSDFPFEPRLMQSIVARGYTIPTPVQDEAIMPILAGKDLIGLANTGTGKTAAFLLPIINNYLKGADGTALILVPTRELATQIEDEFKLFARGTSLRSVVIVGGASMVRQKEAIKRRPQVVIGTPGRMKDLIENHGLKLSGCKTFVLDEADRMLDMGFVRDIKFIIAQLPVQRQSLCFSATINPEVETIINSLLNDPVKVSVKTSETSSQVEQNIIKAVSRDHKLEILRQILDKPDFDKVLVFGDTKYGVQRLADKLVKLGVPAVAIHGNKSQPQRQRALDDFKRGRARVLVATDVAARGLDIPNVTHVINYEQPKTYADYVHRIGRTGRAGQVGQALTFVEG